MSYELQKRSIPFKRQVAVPVVYEGLRLDLLVAERVVVELKAVEKMTSLFEAQLLSYLRLADLSLGLLINFNVPLIKDGIKRIVV